MPFANQHAARIRKPDFPSYARKNIAPGVDVILGIRDGKSTVQAYRFDKAKFSPEEAQKWLADHKVHPISFEPAVTKEIDDANEEAKIYGGNVPWQKDNGANTEVPARLPSSPVVPISDSPGLDGATEPVTRRVPDVKPQQAGKPAGMPSVPHPESMPNDPAIDRPSTPNDVGKADQMPLSPLLAPTPPDAGRQSIEDPVKRHPANPEPYQTYKYDTAEIKGIEILREGIWNKTKVTVRDMAEMVVHFKEKVLEPFLNLDHDDKYTDRVKRALKVAALGFVSDLRIEGDRLVADFKQVPIKIAELIQGGALKKRSVEFYTRDYEVNGRRMNNVLRAVSFFGADVPAVNALSDDFAVLMTRVPEVQMGELTVLTVEETKRKPHMEIEATDYQALTLKASKADQVDAELLALKAEKEAIEKEAADLRKFKAEAEAKEAAAADGECEAFIKKCVDAGKIHPDHAEAFKSIAKHLKKTMPEGHAAFVSHFEGKKTEMKKAVLEQVAEPVTQVAVNSVPQSTKEAHEKIVAFCREKGLNPERSTDYIKAMSDLGLSQE